MLRSRKKAVPKKAVSREIAAIQKVLAIERRERDAQHSRKKEKTSLGKKREGMDALS